MDERPNIEVEIREPTGLGLGIYDLFVIRQKIYTGELRPECEYFDVGVEQWRPLTAHPAFADVFWLTGADRDSVKKPTRAKFGGWASKTGIKAIQIDETDAKGKKGGLLGKFFSRK